jgi:hypothetical protein
MAEARAANESMAMVLRCMRVPPAALTPARDRVSRCGERPLRARCRASPRPCRSRPAQGPYKRISTSMNSITARPL